jgi:homocysteine S-methyltransferase
MTLRDRIDLSRVHVLDGGMATELERLGADISGPLWSAHVLEDAPEKVMAVHRAYVQAGADVLLTASYQVSRMGYAELGWAPGKADAALLRSVELAREVCREFPERELLVAASLGPYGAALHDGAEYHGNYDCSFAELVEFHQARIAVLAESNADLLAFETLPSLEEARAIGEALEAWPEIAAWFAFNCPQEQAAEGRVAHGDLLIDCARLVAGFAQSVAVGVNCTPPSRIARLITEVRTVTNLPIVVYPNSGEDWDAASRQWKGPSSPEEFEPLAREWFEAGAQLVGGCCRTGPDHVRKIAAESRRLA